MGDVKPPSSGTGDSRVLLLIHDYGSNFSDAVERISRRQKMSMLQKSKSVDG